MAEVVDSITIDLSASEIEACEQAARVAKVLGVAHPADASLADILDRVEKTQPWSNPRG